MVLNRPDPKAIVRGIDRRATKALKALSVANKGKEAERTGVSAKTLGRPNTK